jgi:hypothetical protein
VGVDLVVADSSFSPSGPPAWFVATDQGVVLAGPFADRAAAWAARGAVITKLRADLMRDRRPGWFVARRLRAVQVRFGVLTGPWQHLQSLSPPHR